MRVLQQQLEKVPDDLPFKELLAAAQADNTVDPFDAIEMLGVTADTMGGRAPAQGAPQPRAVTLLLLVILVSMETALAPSSERQGRFGFSRSAVRNSGSRARSTRAASYNPLPPRCLRFLGIARAVNFDTPSFGDRRAIGPAPPLAAFPMSRLRFHVPRLLPQSRSAVNTKAETMLNSFEVIL